MEHPAFRVNLDPPPTLDEMGNPILDEIRSQFFPHVAVDQSTGLVIVAWHDPRNDDGGSDAKPNTETEVFVAISTDGGDNFTNEAVSEGFSAASNPMDIEASHGDYLGVDIRGGIAHVAWVDNSNSVGDNPDPSGTIEEPGACDVVTCTDPEDPETCEIVTPVACMDAYTVRAIPEPGSTQQIVGGALALFALTRRRKLARR